MTAEEEDELKTLIYTFVTKEPQLHVKCLKELTILLKKCDIVVYKDKFCDLLKGFVDENVIENVYNQILRSKFCVKSVFMLIFCKKKKEPKMSTGKCSNFLCLFCFCSAKRIMNQQEKQEIVKIIWSLGLNVKDFYECFQMVKTYTIHKNQTKFYSFAVFHTEDYEEFYKKLLNSMLSKRQRVNKIFGGGGGGGSSSHSPGNAFKNGMFEFSALGKI